jgi:hypothetical protein
MSSGWFYSKAGVGAGEHVGPLTWNDLLIAAREGVISRHDLVWNETLPDWQPAASVPGLFPPAPAPVAAAPAYAAAPGYDPPARSRLPLLTWLIPLIVVIAVGAGLGAYFGTRGHHPESAANATAGAAFSQQEGEILLEPSGQAGPDSFAGEQFVAQGPTTTLNIPSPAITLPAMTTTTTASTTTTSASTTTTASTTTGGQAAPTAPTGAQAQPVLIASYPGDTPALYGGSNSKLISDKEQELAFLEQHPEKAAAFCEALNSDPTLRWSQGTTVSPGQLRAYFSELTPVLLTRDTRVTNYGYRNGHPTPRQSVLQAGQLVLVDQYGVPRKRCECGNPLTPPRPASRPPVYTGPKWPGFNPTTIIIVQQTTVIINNFTIIDIYTGQPFGRPAGTNGGSDGEPQGSTAVNWGPKPGEEGGPPSEGGTGENGTTGGTGGQPSGGSTGSTGGSVTQPASYELDVIMDREDAGSKRTMHIEWTVKIIVNPDGSLSGSGPGGWHVEGTIYEKQTATGTFSADAAFGVNVTGGVEMSGEDRNLRIKQAMTDYQLQNVQLDTTSDRAEAQAAIETEVEAWLKDAFTDILLPATSSDIYGAMVAGSYSGSANLLPQK